MPSPNTNPLPQPDDAIILRGAIQIEAALAGLQVAGLNPELQDELEVSLEESRAMASKSEASGIGLNYTWFKIGEDVPQVKRDVICGLGKLAEQGAEAGEDEALVLAADSLKELLNAK